jgi:hypothetical protein
MFTFLRRKANKFKHMYQNSDFELELIYDNGKHRFYTYKNPIQIPYKRTEAALIFSRYAQLCLTPERLNEYLKAIIIANNKGDRSLVGTFANHLLITDEHYGERQSLLNLATVYTVLEGEPADKFNQQWQEKKKEIFQADEDCRDFFLTWAYQKTPNFMKTQKNIILNYLKDMEAVNELFHSILEDTLQDLPKVETK